MHVESNVGFRVEETDRRVIYCLGPSAIGRPRWVALVIVLVVLYFVWSDLRSLGVTSSTGNGAPWFFRYGFLLVSAGIELTMTLLSLWILFGRDEIELSERFLTAVIRIGPLRWSRHVRRELIRRLTIEPTRSQGATVGSDLHADLGPGGSRVLARVYPEESLRLLAAALSDRLAGIPVELTRRSDGASAETAVDGVSGLPPKSRDRHRQPRGSTAIVARGTSLLKITIPRARPVTSVEGFSGMIVGTLFWCSIVLVLSCLFARDHLHGRPITWKHSRDPVPLWSLILFFTPFWAIGIAMVLGIVHVVLREARITLGGGILTLDRRGVRGWNRREWPIDAVRSVTVDVQVTDSKRGLSRATSLKIEPNDGPPLLLLDYREERELEWIATVLRDGLSKARRGGRGPELDRDSGPSGS